MAAKKSGLLVEEFGIGFPPRLISKKIGETIYSLNLVPLGGFVRIHGEKREAGESEALQRRSFWFLPVSRRALIIVAGVAMNFLAGWLLISSIYIIGAPNAVIISGVTPGTPAATAGLQAGDRIIGFEKSSDLIAFVASAKGKEISLRVTRDGQELELKAVPRLNPPAGQGALGVTLTDVGLERLPFLTSLKEGWVTSVKILGSIFLSLANLISGIFVGAPVLQNFVGPVGIFQIANQASKFGLIYLLQLIGLISLNLTALNILPLPALDGGRLLFLLIEKIKGSPLNQKFEIYANAIGFALLLLLMVVITVRDVVKLF